MGFLTTKLVPLGRCPQASNRPFANNMEHPGKLCLRFALILLLTLSEEMLNKARYEEFMGSLHDNWNVSGTGRHFDVEKEYRFSSSCLFLC